MYFICHTTRYRQGGAKFARAARTLRDELLAVDPTRDVRLQVVEHKAQFVAAMQAIREAGAQIDELHFLGHSGMYGIMFGSQAWPEQFSPHEWRSLDIPFASGGAAYFHACRSARWFAPFFARTFGVRAYGHQGYTTVSARPDRFVFEGFASKRAHIYLVSVPGRKTHGIFGSLRKYTLMPRVVPMVRCEPEPPPVTSYDRVAELYDRAFADIRVRREEWRWLSQRVEQARADSGRPLRMLDVGCGNGALLCQLRERIALGVGVDTSRPMVECASRRAATFPSLRFETIDGPVLPFPDGAFDLVSSFLSFRYLDWDPMLREIRRVLAPGGRLLLVDMVERALGLGDTPLLLKSAARYLERRLVERPFSKALRALTRHPNWKSMLEHNPIRAEHEYRWFLQSRFPGRQLATLSVGRRARLVAFDSGPLEPGAVAPLSYP